MWSGQSDKNEDKQPPVNFGMDSSWQSLNDKTDITITSHRPSEDVSQNASPSTVDEDASECESLTEPQDDQRCLSSLPHSERHRAPIQDNHKQHSKIQENQIRHNEFQDRQRHFPDFQDSHTELEDSQRNAVDYPDNQGCQAELEDSRGHSGEFKDTHPRHHTKLPDIQRRQPRFPENPNHVIIELQDSRLYVDFLEGHQRLDTRSSGKQGPDAFPRKSCSEPQTSHRQRAQAQSHPTIIYSDDKMEMFSDSNLLSMQDREEGGMKMDPFSPSLDRPAGSGHPDPSTYIYRSRSDCGKASLPQSAPASTSGHHRAKRKRRAKKWPRLSPSLQFNQNNSDDSNDGSSQPSGDRTDSEGEGAEGTPQSPSHPHPSSHALPSSSERGHGSASSVPGEKGHHSASSWPGERGHHSASSSPGERGHHSASSSPGERRHPNASSSAGERGQWCADRYSSTDSGGEEGCDGGQGSSVRQRGARPKVRSRSWHRAREYISRTSTPHNSPMWPQLDRGGFGTSSRTDLTGTLSPLLMYKMYEVRHPDEPYPFRMARSHRKMQERSSTSGQPHPNDYPHPNDHSHPNDHPRPNDHSRPNDHPYPNDHSRTPACVEMLEGNTSANGLGQDTESVTACAQPSSDTASHPPHQPPTTSPPHPLRHLEGGGEGASATVRADSRKSGRDVLLRRAMENSYILATTGREAFHSSPHGLPSTAASLDAGLSQVSDQAARSGAAPSSPQGAVGMRTEGLWGEPSGQASVGPSCRRKDQQGGADPSAVPAPSPPHTQRTLLGRKLLDLTPAPLSSTAPRPHAFPYTLSGLHLPAHTASQQGTSSTQEEGIQHSLADSMDSTGWTRVLKEKAGDSSGRQCPWPVSPCGASQLPSPLCALDPARGTSQERRVKLTGEGGVEDGAGRTSGVWRPVSLIAHTQWEAAGCQLPHGPVDTGIPQSSDSRGQVPSPSAPSPGPSRLVKQDTCSLPECRSPKQSMLKSAMKQQGGRLCPDVESSAQTPRRVSFSEHHIHIRNSLDCVLDSGGQREVGVAQCSSDTGLGRGVESATSGCCDPLRERDAHRYGDARSDPTCGRLEAGSRGFTQAFSSSSTSANTPQLSALPAFSGAELRWPWHDAGGYPDSLWHRSLPLSTHPPHRQEAAGYPSTRTEVWVPEKSSACPGREASRPSSPTPASHTSPFVGPRGRAREGVLVDIEPHTLSPLQGDLMDSAGRLSPPVRLQQSGATPLYSNLLLTPLTPQPAVDIPTLAGVHSTQEHRHSTQEPGDGGRRVTEAPTHHATGGRVTPAEPNLPQGGLSLRSFQEMLAARSPGAFFRPIDPTEKSGEPED